METRDRTFPGHKFGFIFSRYADTGSVVLVQLTLTQFTLVQSQVQLFLFALSLGPCFCFTLSLVSRH